MPVLLNWDTELERILVFTFESPWTWDEYRQAVRAAQQMVKVVGTLPYDVIGDFRQLQAIPIGAGLTYVAEAFRLSPPNLNGVVIVSSSAVIMTFVSIFNRIHPLHKPFLVVHSLEQARRLIDKHRATHGTEPSGS